MLSESKVEMTQALAKATDSTQLSTGSYSAQFHELMPKVVIVDTPCGCRVAINSWGEALLTLCMSDQCVFDWAQAHQAHQLLMESVPGPKPIEITGVSVKSQEAPIAEEVQ